MAEKRKAPGGEPGAILDTQVSTFTRVVTISVNYNRLTCQGRRFFHCHTIAEATSTLRSHPERASGAGVARQHPPESTRAAHGLIVGAKGKLALGGAEFLASALKEQDEEL